MSSIYLVEEIPANSSPSYQKSMKFLGNNKLLFDVNNISLLSNFFFVFRTCFEIRKEIASIALSIPRFLSRESTKTRFKNVSYIDN